MSNDRRGPEVSTKQANTEIQSGTRAMGVQAGTVSYTKRFAGTPSLAVQLMQGSSRIRNIKTPSLYSGSFTYRFIGSGGTLSYIAAGPLR